MQISVELVPRSTDYRNRTLADIQETLPQVNAINIPDLTRLDIRSWEGCSVASRYFPTAIPHLRATDVDPGAPLPMSGCLRRHRIDTVLIVSGDPPEGNEPPKYPVSSLDLIQRFKREMADVKVYAALDPYRQSFHQEYAYLQEKLDAGVDGFFTQPFFDLRLMEIYADLLESVEVYWGISPVLTERSYRYWIKRNHAIFPKDFTPTLAWNQRFARQALGFVRERKSHTYFMPIRVNIQKYLGGIL